MEKNITQIQHELNIANARIAELENSLQQSEGHFQNIIDGSPIPFALHDENRKITYLNSAFTRSFGYQLTDIPRLADWWPRAYPNETYRKWVWDTWQDHMNVAKQSGTAIEPFEHDIQCKNGEKRTVLAGVVALSGIHEKKHLITLYDVTERKLAQQAYYESKSQYRSIVETAQEGIWTIDSQGRTTFVNPAMANMLGYSAEEMLEQPIINFMDKQDLDNQNIIFDWFKLRISTNHEIKFLSKDGASIWTELKSGPLFNRDGNFMGTLVMITNVTVRKKIEIAHNNTQKLLLRTEILAHAGSWEWDMASNRVQWSPEMYRIYQLDPEKHHQIDFELSMKRVHPADITKIEIHIQNILATGNSAFIDYRIILPNNDIRYLWSESEIVKNSNGLKTHMVGFVQDISERAKIEDALREGNKRFKVLFEQSSFGVSKINSHTGKFIEINQRYCDLLGYNTEEMLTMTFQAITFDEDLPADLAKMEQLKANKIPSFQIEKRYITKNNAILWVNLSVIPLWQIDTEPDFHLAIIEDITARKLIEKKLRLQQMEQQQLVNNIADAIIVIDERGILQTFSKSAETIFSYTAAEVIGQTINHLMPSNEATRHNSHISDYLSTNLSNIIGIAREVQGKRKNGEIFPMRLSVSELPKTTAGLRRFMGACRDITHEKQQEEQLRRSQKMDALGKLTGGIAHDYNNMLGVIIGYSQLLQEALTDDPVLHAYINEIHHASERGIKLSRKLLGFSKNIQPEAKAININDLLSSEQDMLQKTLTPRINLEFEFEIDPWPIFVNSGEFEDAILNLSINAMHAMQAGGKLNIQTCNITLDPITAERHKLLAGDYVLLTITDTGSGIHRKDMDFIFDPFYTTKDDGGFGLGLSMVHGFVQRSGGSISVTSNIGQGSQFELYFPRYANQPTPVSIATSNVITSNHGSETILVVDDEISIVELSREILVAKGYQVKTANNAESALSIMANETIDMLVSDVVMPSMDGYQLAAKIRLLNPNIHILLVSGYTENFHIQHVGSDINEILLQKPYKPSELLSRIREILDGKRIPEPRKKRSILVMDDDEDILQLFDINLTRLDYEVIIASNGEDAISIYREFLSNTKKIDAVILDISIPGGMGGKEVAQEILAVDPNAKLIVASGDTFGPEMTNYKDYGFKATLDKEFNREKMKNILDLVLD